MFPAAGNPFFRGVAPVRPEIRAVLALVEIKSAIDAFESGDDNAVDTLSRILQACMAAKEYKASSREAA